ncbi:cold shock domain-containing protein, partial [Pseudomonas aeruginosa]|uniref:cold shock domain-containing protein n=1 Tax=Pseudomonas aeruginosa TaxID=287 RepID=UPI003014E1B3
VVLYCLPKTAWPPTFITPSDGRIDVQLHVSALNLRDAEEITTGLRVEFCRINGLRGPSAANVYLS